MNSASPRYVVAAIAVLLLLGCANPEPAQSQEASPPEATEVWKPEPVVVSAPVGAPPSDAIVLFDGSNLNAWSNANGEAAGWTIADGAMTVRRGSGAVKTRQSFGDVQLHIEWRTPSEVAGEGQGRGNSGVFLMERYEVQVLDSYNNRTYSNGQAGSVYKQYSPLVNASRGPGEWQTYDIVFMAPRFSPGGELQTPGRVTVFHNGVLIQNNVELRGPTVYRGEPKYEAHGARQPLMLQDHGNPVSYRNVWVREL